MSVRKEIEQKEIVTLAPFASFSCKSKGRQYKEKEHEYRTAFQRDRDRVIHSTAFRRLGYKTQVFVNHEGDHYRTRLTHSIEVAQISKTLARILSVNEDLAETVALAHDLGHGPFGHATETALSKLMKNHGGFDHNEQSVRVVEVLEDRYPAFLGLNLTWEVLNGMRKHDKARKGKALSLEGQIADAADDIAYNAHDLDDGLRAGFFTEKDLSAHVPFWKEIYTRIEKQHKKGSIYHKRLMAIRVIINWQVDEMVKNTRKNLKKHHIETYEDVMKCKAQLVCFNETMKRKMLGVRQFLNDQLYHHYRVARMTDKAQRFIEEIFRVYEKSPKTLPTHFYGQIKKTGLYRAICDYIAGMTDRYALDEYRRLFAPYERV